MSSHQQVVVSGGFDEIKSRDLRFLEEAAKLGTLTVLRWPDATLVCHADQAESIKELHRLVGEKYGKELI